MTIEKRINKALDEIRPYLQRDGGDIRLVEVVNNIAKIEFLGYCSTCNKNRMTLSSVSSVIREAVTEIKEVIE